MFKIIIESLLTPVLKRQRQTLDKLHNGRFFTDKISTLSEIESRGLDFLLSHAGICLYYQKNHEN